MSQQTDAAITSPAATGAASRFDATTTFAVLRSAVGVGTWISPKASYRTFGLGVMDDTPANVLVARLFAVRELLFGLGLKHPEPQVRRAVLQAGMVADSVDVVASLIALGKGAPKGTWAGFVLGASTFVALGAVALAEEQNQVG